MILKHFHRVCIAAGVAVFLGAGTDCGAGIVYPEPPAGGREVVYNDLANETYFFGAHAQKRMTIASPYMYYGNYPGDLISGHMLRRASRMRWIYPVMRGDKPLGAVWLDVTAKRGKAPECIGSEGGQGGYADDHPSADYPLARALRVAARLPQVKAQDYEVRYLDNMELGFFAVWLHGKSDDILIPIPNGTADGLLKAYQPYSEGEVTRLLKQDAKETIAGAKKGYDDWMKAGGPASGPPPVQF